MKEYKHISNVKYENRFRVDNNRVMTKEYVIFLGLIFAGIISTFCCLFNQTQFEYQNLYLLPMGYTLINVLFFKNARGMISNYIKGILMGVCFVKGIFTPFLMGLEGCQTFFSKISYEGVNFSIALLLYEYLCVMFCISWFSSKKYISHVRIKTKKKYNFGIIVVLGVIFFCMISYIAIPELRSSFLSVFKLSDVLSLDGSTSIPLGLRRSIFTLARMLFPIALVYLVSLIIFAARRKGETTGTLIFSGMSTILFLFFVSEETGYFVICILVVSMLIYQLYPSKRRMLKQVGVVLFVVAIVGIYYAKLTTVSGDMKRLGSMFQAYFPGVANTAGIYGYSSTVPKFVQWLYEIYNAIPFKTTLFGKVYDRLVIDYCTFNGTIYQIIPLSAQAYYFYGFLLAPIDAIILCTISLKYYEKAQECNNTLKFCTYTLIAIYAAVSIGMYNMTTFFSKVLTVFCPMLLIMHFTNDDKCSFDRLMR